MLRVFSGASEFTWMASNIFAVRPAAAQGVVVTPAQNAKGAYVTLLTAAEVTTEVFMIDVNFNSGGVSTRARDILADIGIDPAGGTAFAVLLPDLLASCASGLDVGPGHNYRFPIRIPAGASVGVRASVNNATVGTLRSYVTVYGRPRDPSLVRAGTFCTAFGIVAASSRGTLVVPGSGSEGAWTAIGSPARDHWYAQIGMGVSDATMQDCSYYGDLAYGDAGAKDIIIRDQMWQSASNEMLAGTGCLQPPGRWVKSGNTLYTRLQTDAPGDTNTNMAVYLIGG